MKKIISLSLSLCLILSSLPSFAATVKQSDTQANLMKITGVSVKEDTGILAETANQLAIQKAEIKKIYTVDLTKMDTLTKNKVLQVLNVKEKIDVSMGALEKETITIVEVNETTKSLATASVSVAAAMPNYSYRYVLFNNQYNSQTINLIGSGTFVQNAITTGYNILIGTTTKLTWVISTILGINASMFLPYGYPGDALYQHTQTLQTLKDCQILAPGTTKWWGCSEAEKKVVTIYEDLYTVTKDFKPFHKPGSSSFTYYSSCFNDDSRLYQKAREYFYYWNGMSFWRDLIS
jgi:hypothetical protein